MSPRLRYQEEVARGLREVADAIEAGNLDASSAVLLTGGLGEMNVVHALGGIDAHAALGSLAMAQHILLNAVMPDGNTTET